MRIWIRRSLFSFARCVVLMLVFPYALDIRSSNAQDHSVLPLIGAIPKIQVPALKRSAPSFELAARQGIAELLGSGDHSIVGWSPGPDPIGVTLGGQESALDALTAVLPTT